MNINPEFRRNLWLELTPARLAGMPMILGVLFFLSYLLDNKQYGESVAGTALFLFGLLAFLWGTRLASESLVTEIRDHTWDSQRMSVIGPWSMTWGKLLGSTAYPWYGALICMLVYLTSKPSLGLSLIETIVLMVGSGLLGQAIGLLASLQAMRKSLRYGRFQTTAFLVLGAGCGFTVLTWPFAESTGIVWYGHYFSDERFVITSLVVFLAWAVLAIYRLIRSELQLQSLPWVWVLFMLFLAGYVAGFSGGANFGTGQQPVLMRLLSVFMVMVLLAYAAAFSERKDPIAFRRLLQALERRQWTRALTNFPLWLSSLPFVLVACAALVVFDLSTASGESAGFFAVPAIAAVLFLLRDLALMLFFNFGRNPKRADMLTLLWLVLLYGVIPTILSALDLDLVAGMFWTLPGASAAVVLPAAFCQALVISWLTFGRWRRLSAEQA